MISKLIVAVCVVNMASSGYTSGWGDEKKVASVIDEKWSVPGSAQANSRALLGKGGSGGNKGGSSGSGKGGNSGSGKGGNSGGGKKDDNSGGSGKKDDKSDNDGDKKRNSEDKKDKKKKDKKKGCDDDVTGEPFWSTEGWWTTDDEDFTTELPSEEPTPEPTTEPTQEREEFVETLAPSVDPTTEPTDEPTTEPTDEPTTEPTSSPTDEPTTEPSFSPSTAAPSTEPTEEPTRSPSTEPTNGPSQEPTVEPTSPPTCPDATAIEGGAFIPCDCYDVSLCPEDDCYEEDGNCYTVPSLVAVISEQSDANEAQAIAVEEVTTTTSETNHGYLIAALLAGMALATLIGSGIALYFYKQRQKAYGGVAPHAVSEVDTATMMNGASNSLEWQTNVLAYDEEAILSQENGVRV